MPKHMEEILTIMEKEFFNNRDGKPMIGLNTLRQPIEEGGKKVLDIKVRNEAIEIMKTQRYLKLDKERPRWATLADKIINMKIAKARDEDEDTLTNTILQKTKVDTRAMSNGLPASLQRMVKVAKKYRVNFITLTMEKEMKEEMPAWRHPNLGKDKKCGIKTATMICMRKTHKIQTIGDMNDLGNALTQMDNDRHKSHKNCACPICKELQRKGCSNPHKCSKTACTYISKLDKKWNPNHKGKDRNIRDDEREMITGEDTHIFELNLTTKGPLRDGFRVFVKQTQDTETQIDYERTYQRPPDLITVYTDRSCIRDENGNKKAGAGIWFGENDLRNRAIRLPDDLAQTNNAGEAVAILVAAQSVPKDQAILIKSDSKLILDNITKDLKKREDEGWIGMANKSIMRPLVVRLKERSGITLFNKVKGHTAIRGNEEADKLAGIGAKKTTPDNIDLESPAGYNLPGAKLANITQALAYKGILEGLPKTTRKGTEVHLDMTRWAAKERTGEMPTDEVIWKALKDKDLSKQIKAFMWKAMHNGYKIGKYWENIKDLENRAICPKCRVTETLEHILTECEASGQEVAWNFARTLHEKRGLDFEKPSLGDQLGCAINKTLNEENKGTRRFKKIVITETMYTIWKIRCEWRIARDSDPERTISDEETVGRLRAAIGRKIKYDCLAIDRNRFGKIATDSETVVKTWTNLPPEEFNPLRSWRKLTAVLVGIG
ncbi:Ribonuclease H1 [Termitomyces sp. J132]|nr:Ribonuclease H1 [Termitomyces sp. J132]